MQHIGTKLLETERLILRRYRMQDADDMFANWVTDSEVARFWDWETHKEIGTTQALLKQWINEYEKFDYYHWIIVCKSNMQAIGYIYLNAIDDSNCSAEVHYLLSRAYWNQGIMSEACKRVIEFAFHDVGFRKIHSYHHCDNPASGRVMQKCGMTFIRAESREMDNPRLSGEYHYYEVERRGNKLYQKFEGIDICRV
uniref:GNAT family N-acetyltransferase n=1 Tax=Acetatifactor sp. TaxID=1872090 RepID=UPI004056EB02